MWLDLSKKVFDRDETRFLSDKLFRALEKGYITPAPENNTHLIHAYKGVEEKGITPKWNIKIYRFNQKNEAIV